MPILQQIITVLAGAADPPVPVPRPDDLFAVARAEPVIAALGRLLQAVAPVVMSLAANWRRDHDARATVREDPRRDRPADPVAGVAAGPFTSLVPVFAQIITQLVGALAPILVDLVPIIGQILAALQDLIANGLSAILAAIMAAAAPAGEAGRRHRPSPVEGTHPSRPIFLKVFQAFAAAPRAGRALLNLTAQVAADSALLSRFPGLQGHHHPGRRIQDRAGCL